MTQKLTLEELPDELESQFLLTHEMMEKRKATVYDLMFLIGRKGIRMNRGFNIRYKDVDEGILFCWRPAALYDTAV